MMTPITPKTVHTMHRTSNILGKLTRSSPGKSGWSRLKFLGFAILVAINPKIREAKPKPQRMRPVMRLFFSGKVFQAS
jgi:hypothetical protein